MKYFSVLVQLLIPERNMADGGFFRVYPEERSKKNEL